MEDNVIKVSFLDTCNDLVTVDERLFDASVGTNVHSIEYGVADALIREVPVSTSPNKLNWMVPGTVAVVASAKVENGVP